MKVQSRLELESSKTFINVVLTELELLELYEGKVVSIDDEHLQVQIVGYGEEEVPRKPTPLQQRMEDDRKLFLEDK